MADDIIHIVLHDSDPFYFRLCSEQKTPSPVTVDGRTFQLVPPGLEDSIKSGRLISVYPESDLTGTTRRGEIARLRAHLQHRRACQTVRGFYTEIQQRFSEPGVGGESGAHDTQVAGFVVECPQSERISDMLTQLTASFRVRCTRHYWRHGQWVIPLPARAQGACGIVSDGGRGDQTVAAEDMLLTPMEAPRCHSVFDSTEGCAVYRSLEDAMKTFGNCTDVSGSNTSHLLEIVKDRGSLTNKEDKSPVHPLIVVEGLDGTGKSTLTRSLSERLGAQLMSSPPPYISHMRSWFDSQNPSIRRAFYTIGNYLVAGDIRDKLRNGPVVMDRFWHSTAAYAIATASVSVAECSLPPPGHWVYRWPRDLLRPDIVILLTVSEEARLSRISGRHTRGIVVETAEEKKMAQDAAFRDRLSDAYRQMVDPHVVEVDASSSRNDVISAVTRILYEQQIITDVYE